MAKNNNGIKVTHVKVARPKTAQQKATAAWNTAIHHMATASRAEAQRLETQHRNIVVNRKRKLLRAAQSVPSFSVWLAGDVPTLGNAARFFAMHPECDPRRSLEFTTATA